jgi:hypothetical protein
MPQVGSAATTVVDNDLVMMKSAGIAVLWTEVNPFHLALPCLPLQLMFLI